MDREIYLKISKPRAECILCGAPLAEMGKHPSVLLPPAEGTDENEGDIPQRQDYCAECWEKCSQHNYVGFWVARREPPRPRKVQNRRERNARLAAYFDYFYHDQNGQHAGRLFFLAHLLMRYGVLRWLRTEKDPETQRERIVYRHVVADEDVVIESVELSDEELVLYKREVEELLAGTLGASEARPETPVAQPDAPAPEASPPHSHTGENPTD